MKYVLCLLHVIVLCIYRKEHDGELCDGLVCSSLSVGSGGGRLTKEGQQTTHSRMLYELMRRKRRGAGRRRRNNRSAKRRNRRRNKRLAKQRKARCRKAKKEQRRRKRQRKRADRKRKRKEKKRRRQERKEKKKQRKRQMKEQKEKEAEGPSDGLEMNTIHDGDDGVVGQAGPPLAEESYTDGVSSHDAAEEGASSAVGRGAMQVGSHPPGRTGGPIDPFGSYPSSLHDDSIDDSSHPKQAGVSTALVGGSPYEADLGTNVKVIHLEKLKSEPKGELINKIRGILNTLE
ncbi:Uncharacterized protein PCOAH_00003280 [Plasmodium coatneyi]|uniref:Uncharacterized protein n=1 Tax=Plasmodium coatneyi TaxID=208452 RepID=A0A1B1DTB8_9APIC|nr:Uncharacterized protein PCOAH_00003280 [Plasmodium coatneyi]ANQ05984.1 Uncharacterized protein PCOAH_00003280 [Plasmodium coatneyi]